jgi:hypothetical protein
MHRWGLTLLLLVSCLAQTQDQRGVVLPGATARPTNPGRKLVLAIGIDLCIARGLSRDKLC